MKKARRVNNFYSYAKGGCVFCKEKTMPDYKNPDILGKFTSDRDKILNRTLTGLCAKHQRWVTREIKLARHLGLLPFASKVR